MTSFVPPQKRQAWQALQGLAKGTQPHLRELLKDAHRNASLHASGAGISIDYERQRVTPEVMQQLLALADESQVMQQAQAMFKGEPINATEQRAVLHVALRGSHVPNPPWGHEISKQVANELHRVCTFAEKVREGQMKGFGGESITDVVNLGIGGSDLGPRMTTEALSHLTRDSFKNKVRVHYVSNVDAWSLYTALAYLNPARTAFVVQSKTFTTQETMTLAASAKRWLTDGGCPTEQLGKHLIAVTANPHISAAQGFTPEHTFGFWDWVGATGNLHRCIRFPRHAVRRTCDGRAFHDCTHRSKLALVDGFVWCVEPQFLRCIDPQHCALCFAIGQVRLVLATNGHGVQRQSHPH
jgi:glucose-6-phosphate isomerase